MATNIPSAGRITPPGRRDARTAVFLYSQGELLWRICSAERGETAATEGTNPPAGEVLPENMALADVLLALAQEERAAEGWGDWTTVIPPAPASLAWMSAEVERLATQPPPCLEPRSTQGPKAEGVLLLVP